MNNDFSAVILSSGLSERMGQPKAMLKWDGSTSFIEKIIHEFQTAGCTRIICTINEVTEPFCRSLTAPENVTFVVNHHPDWGRFYSVRTGLKELKDTHFCFVHNVDNPFVNVEIIEKLLLKRDPGSWCSPVFRGKGGHPVLLSGPITERVLETLNLDSRLSDILNQYRVIKVEMNNDLSLRNINTPEDYSKYISAGK